MQPEPIRTQRDLATATGQDPFVLYDAALTPGEVAYAHRSAVAIRVQPHFSRRLPRFVVIGSVDADAHDLLAWAAREEPWGPLRAVSVERHRESTLHEHFTVGDGGNWDWMWSTSVPEASPAEHQLIDLDDERDAAELLALNELGNPTSESEPGTGRTDRWVGVRERGHLVAAGALHRSKTGHGVLTGIVVHPAHRGVGLGHAITAALTRHCVEEDGVATLGMYADNATARALYERLGYQVAHAFASRHVAPSSRFA